MKSIRHFFCVAGLLLVSACQSTPPANAEVAPPAELRNTLWKLTALNGTPIKTRDGQRMASLTLTSEEAQARMATACNRGTSRYTLAGKQLTFSVAAATKMMCPADQMQEEAAYFKAMQTTVRYEIKGEVLQLFDAGNQEVASFHSEYL